MTAYSCSAILMAAALLISPNSANRRLAARRPTAPIRPRHVGYAAAAAIPVLSLLWSGPLAACAVIVLTGTVAVRRERRAARLRAAGEARDLEGALDVVISELRVGTHPVGAFAAAAEEIGGAVGASLRTVSARAGLGADVPEGLRSAAVHRASHTHWERLAACWELATEHGLAISTLMHTAAVDIGERQRFSSRIAAGMAGARATAAILAGLPLLAVALGESIGASPVAFLLSPAGGWFLLAGSLLACAGLLWADRITDRLTA